MCRELLGEVLRKIYFQVVTYLDQTVNLWLLLWCLFRWQQFSWPSLNGPLLSSQCVWPILPLQLLWHTSPTVYQAYCYFKMILSHLVCPYQSKNFIDVKSLKTRETKQLFKNNLLMIKCNSSLIFFIYRYPMFFYLQV